MAESWIGHVSPTVVHIANPSDLTIRLIEDPFESGTTITDFRVTRHVLEANSEYFRNSFRHDRTKTLIKLEDDTPTSIALWLRAYHGSIHTNSYLYGIGLDEVWHVINAGDKYVFKRSLLEEWFQRWWITYCNGRDMTVEIASQLALPCYVFNFVNGFQEITRWLAYHSPGQIAEKVPVGVEYTHIHLPSANFSGALNWARSHLIKVLHTELWKPCSELLSKKKEVCTCWTIMNSQYQMDLCDTGAFPLHDFSQNTSIAVLLTRLLGFVPQTRYFKCECGPYPDFTAAVRGAVKEVEHYFAGLCLDCMLGKNRDGDDEYWDRLKQTGGRFDEGCRTTHDQTSWYASWIGFEPNHQNQPFQRRSVPASITLQTSTTPYGWWQRMQVRDPALQKIRDAEELVRRAFTVLGIDDCFEVLKQEELNEFCHVAARAQTRFKVETAFRILTGGLNPRRHLGWADF